MAAQDLDRLAHLKRIADIEAEWNIHVGHDCHNVPAAGLADAHHALGKLLPVFERFHKRAGADLDIQHDGMRACGGFLDMMDDVMSGRESIVAVTSRSA